MNIHFIEISEYNEDELIMIALNLDEDEEKT